uniref:Protein kinase domain-containing protein n=1 Tax=Oryza brachyantha TaxID=4533 RepID=J3LIQ3_ORYBR
MPPLPPCLLLLLLLLFASSNLATASDADALLALKSALDRSDRLPWRRDTAATFCSSWPGVRQCSQAQPPRVTKLVLENLNLTGVLTASLLAPLSDLRVLSLKSNALTGPIPDALPAALPNLKLFYLCDNRLQGRIPPTLALLHRATVLVLSSNRLYGEIPPSLTTLPRLTSLLLDDNLLNGTLPPLPQPTLRLLNVSANRLSGEMENAPAAAPSSAASERGREFSWEREGIGKLVFCGGVTEMYSLEELLRASAETLGRGEVGSTYKAVMETGFIVTVKRMREPAAGAAELGRRAEELGRLRHPNVVALRAYFQAKEERLLVYDYYPNGSLFSLLHGSSSRASSKGKPLHWTSCMKIAGDVAAGLVHLHQSPPAGIVHGNLKPSNVLLGPDFESCLTDYGLVPTLLPSHADLASSASVLYRAPETRAAHLFTPASDVYSFGVLLLELLTGKAPFQDLMDLHGDDIPSWVRAVREEETESGGESASAGGAEEKLGALISIAAACVVVDPARRPTTPEVLRMVREARAEAMSSSNSSDRSPARWSDAVQVQMAMGVPRDQGELGLT